MLKKTLALACVLMVATGCTGLRQNIESEADRANSKVSALVRDVGRAAPGVVQAPTPDVLREPGIWLGKTVVKLGQPSLPPIFYEPTTFDRSVNSLAEMAERITLRSGIPTKVTVDALAASGAMTSAQTPRGGMQSQAGSMPLPRGTPGMSPMLSSNRDPGTFRITYTNGNLKGFLDTVAARFSVYWKYVDGTIHFFHTDARTFQINAIPGDSSLMANVSSGATSTGGGGGGGGGGEGGGGGSGGSVSADNSQKIAVMSQLAVFSSIESSVETMLSSYGRVVASPATGSITVVDTPDTLDRIAVFIDNENKTLSRQVVINVTVLSVNLADDDEYGINWNAIYTSLRETYGIKNTLAASTNAVGISAGIIGTSKYTGSTLLINALSEQGKVRRETTASVVTLNNQPVPVQVAKQTTYLAQSQTTVTQDIGTSTTLVPGVVTSGFNMTLLPHVLTNGTVLLQFSTDISALRDIKTVSSGNSSIQTPEIDTRNFMQRVSMKSNETLVISGFEQTDDNLSRNGSGNASNYFMGGGFRASRAKEVIVILITPTTLSSI